MFSLRNGDYDCTSFSGHYNLDLLLSQAMLPNDKIWCDAVFAIVEVHKPAYCFSDHHLPCALEYIYIHSFWIHAVASVNIEVLEIGLYALHEIICDFGLEFIDPVFVPFIILLQFLY